MQVLSKTRCTTWLENVVPVPKKDGKTRVRFDYRYLNKASPIHNFPLPNIHILFVKCAKHKIQSFVDCYAGYHQILMDGDDAEKIAFTTPWGTYCYRVMPFGLKNVGATYMRAITTMFHDMMHKEIEVYVYDVIINYKTQVDHVQDLRKFLEECEDMTSSLIQQNVHSEFHLENFWVLLSVEGESNWIPPK